MISLAMAMQRYNVGHITRHIQGFTQSHWIPPSGECLCCIAPMAAMVNEFK
jgi:hypothetical protein